MSQQTTTGGSCYGFSAAALTNNQLTGYSYDAAGNMTNDGSHTYTYDAENHIVQVDSGNTASYVYNENGQRVRKTTGSTFTEYFGAANGKVLAEYNGTMYPKEYIYAGDRLIAQYNNAARTTNFIHADHLGTTRVVTGMNQSVVDALDFYPYGLQNSGDTSTTHKFTGKERDSESGLDMFGARYYGSSLGRFMTPDWAAKATAVPYADFGDPQTLNLYGYVRNNPLFRADADGHSDAGTFCNTQCRYGTPVSNAEIQVDIGVLELGSAVATGGATLEAMAAGAALKTALGAIATAGLGVSGTTRIIATAAGEKSENVEEGTTAVTTLTTPAGMAVTLGTGGNLKAGAVASDLTSAATAVKNPVEAAKDPAGTALTVGNVVQDVKAGYNAVKSLVSPPPPPAPPPPPPPPKCTGNDQCH